MSHFALLGKWQTTVRRGEREIHHNRKTLWSLLALPAISFAVACFAYSTPVHATQTVPYKINFQGRVTNTSGTVLPNGTYNMKFRIYDASSGGTLKWNEDRLVAATQGVTVTNGLFSVQLGDIANTLTPTLFTTPDLYLEVELPTLATATTSSPSWTEGAMTRSKFGSATYAFNSDTLDGLDAGAFGQLSTANAFTNTNSITVSNAGALAVSNGTNNIFNVDTTGTGKVTIGTSDASGTVLVLDSNASDPTGTAGAMYYNSGGKFRCYQGGWVDCITTVTTNLQDAYNNDSSGVADITTTSAAKTFLFKAGATYDAAALFDVQNAAGTSLFTIDSTTNSKVYIGDNVADSTGTVLVLDTKNTATNPTGVDGAMYYNSDEKSFRCYKNGLWADCDFASLRSEWVVQEEFANISTTTLSTGSQGWTGATVGATGTATKLNVGTSSTNYDRFGVLQLASAATTASTGWNLRLDTTGMTGVPSNMTTEFDFGPVSANAALATNQTTYIGLHNGVANTTAPTDGMYFRYTSTTTAGNWDRCTQAVCVGTGVARTTTANQYQRFKIQTNSAGTSVEFFINEVSVGSATTNLPTQASTDVYGPSITTFVGATAPSTAFQWKMDYFQVKRNLTTLR